MGVEEGLAGPSSCVCWMCGPLLGHAAVLSAPHMRYPGGRRPQAACRQVRDQFFVFSDFLFQCLKCKWEQRLNESKEVLF